jgi:hypothetical protein
VPTQVNLRFLHFNFIFTALVYYSSVFKLITYKVISTLDEVGMTVVNCCSQLFKLL